MPNQAQVLRVLDEAVLQEELALPVYSGHIKAAMFWSGLDAQSQKLIIDGLNILLRDTLMHVKALKRVRRIYKQEVKKYV